jgi:deferrochelatase/peroxidase EfeB
MQGLLRFGYGKLTEACFLLARIDDPLRAAEWFAQAEVSTAEIQSPPPLTTLQLAFTAQGLQRLELPEQLMNGFSAEFLSGMSGEANRSRRLGDVGDNAPSYWLWGNSDALPDFVALVYAHKEQFDAWSNSVESQIAQAGCTVTHRLTTNDMGDIEPFGFADGVSGPVIDWDRKRDPMGDKLHYENITMLGEFVLGYPNEYGLYTSRPTIEDESADLPEAEDQSGVRDLGRNGSYLVLRQIDQDVHGFWNFFSDRTTSGPEQAQNLAEHFVGRRMTGEPLLELTSDEITGVGPDQNDIRLNRFDYQDDPHGFVCPLGAHIRRANPRNSDLPCGTQDSLYGRLSRILGVDRIKKISAYSVNRDRVASTRFHRLLRRGREYGPMLTQEQRMMPPLPGEPPSGLHFACLSANIGRQFEFVQSAWLHSTSFDGLSEENDPLTGNRETLSGCPAANFTIQVRDGIRHKVREVPRFTTVRGGAYFFLPGVRALRYLARAGRHI